MPWYTDLAEVRIFEIVEGYSTTLTIQNSIKS